MTVNLLDLKGLEIACEAMRLSFNSHSKCGEALEATYNSAYHDQSFIQMWKDDHDLLENLITQGDSHAKVMRMVQVWVEINAPRYWWAEMDTYSIGKTQMSESTIHKILSRDLTEADFEGGMDAPTLKKLNTYRNMLNPDKDTRMRMLKHDLPESFLQRRIVNINYQVLRHIFLDRRNHKLPEWHIFIDWMFKQLPFPEFIMGKV